MKSKKPKTKEKNTKKTKNGCKKARKEFKVVKTYNLVLVLILAVLVITFSLISIIPNRVDQDRMAAFVKPTNYRGEINEEAMMDLVAITGRYATSFEADFVKSPLLLIAKDGKLNLVPAQNKETLKENLCEIFGGSVCE